MSNTPGQSGFNGSTTGLVVVDPTGKYHTHTSAVLGAANLSPGQVTVSNAESLVLAARTTRRQVTLKNTSGTIPVYIGMANTVSASSGYEVAPGETLTLPYNGPIYGITASSTAAMTILEIYD